MFEESNIGAVQGDHDLSGHIPMVSVIMPAYNCVSFIGESIESVQKQTFTDWELLIVDDCSTDATLELIKIYQNRDSRIYVQCLSENSGTAAARNRALELARGQYVAFLDSDDLWHPQKLEKQIDFMKRNQIEFSATGYEQINEQGNPLNKRLIPPRKTNFNKMFYLGDPIGNLTVIYDQKELGKIKVPDIRKRNDYALWLEVLRHTEYCYGMDDILASYRIRSGSISRDKKKLIRHQWNLYRHVEHFSLCKCIIGMITWGIVKATGLQFR